VPVGERRQFRFLKITGRHDAALRRQVARRGGVGRHGGQEAEVEGGAGGRLSEVAGTRGAAFRDVYRLAHPERGKEPAVRAVARWIDATVSRRLERS